MACRQWTGWLTRLLYTGTLIVSAMDRRKGRSTALAVNHCGGAEEKVLAPCYAASVYGEVAVVHQVSGPDKKVYTVQ